MYLVIVGECYRICAVVDELGPGDVNGAGAVKDPAGQPHLLTQVTGQVQPAVHGLRVQYTNVRPKGRTK